MATKKQTATLNEKQRLFAKEYLLDLNATQAAIRAGYSEKTAGQIGFKLLKNVQIQSLITKSIEKVESKLGITAERIMAEYAKLGFSSIADVSSWDEHGNATLRSSKDIGDAVAAIQEIQVLQESCKEDGTIERIIKFKMHPKIAALDSLCKMMGLFVEKREVELSGAPSGPVTITIEAVEAKTVGVET